MDKLPLAPASANDISPSMLEGWLNAFLFQQRRDNVPFLTDFVEEISFTNYALAFKEDRGEVELRLDFEIN